jgi:hypothetical protein
MSDENVQYNEALFARDQQPEGGRVVAALLAGLVAALVAGVIWAVLVSVTNREIGYVAWGVGLLVGFAMSKVTAQRSRQLAAAAGAFAVVGLIAGKAIIFVTSSGSIAEELEADPQALTASLAWQMYDDRTLDQQTLAAVDAVSAGDSLSDAIWLAMNEQAKARLASMTPAQKHEIAVASSQTVIHNMGMVGGIRAQLSGFDLLWLFLAVVTAFRMMAPVRQQDAAEPAVTA